MEYDPDYPDRLRFDPPNKEDMSLYFNLTSGEMAAENHQWDYTNTPEARLEDRGGAAAGQ